jgi:hypothetical protein
MRHAPFGSTLATCGMCLPVEHGTSNTTCFLFSFSLVSHFRFSCLVPCILFSYSFHLALFSLSLSLASPATISGLLSSVSRASFCSPLFLFSFFCFLFARPAILFCYLILYLSSLLIGYSSCSFLCLCLSPSPFLPSPESTCREDLGVGAAIVLAAILLFSLCICKLGSDQVGDA